jgi:hypothetical protein
MPAERTRKRRHEETSATANVRFEPSKEEVDECVGGVRGVMRQLEDT